MFRLMKQYFENFSINSIPMAILNFKEVLVLMLMSFQLNTCIFLILITQEHSISRNTCISSLQWLMESLAFLSRSGDNVVNFSSSLATRFLLQGFDENDNGMLDGLELVNYWNEAVLQHDELITFAERAWNDSEIDGDKKTGTKTELVQFILRLWNKFV